jgi:Ca2+-binding RTX toxin-like protein
MAHLSSYDEFETVLNEADELYAADIVALNSSGVSGTVIFAIDYDTGTLSVSVGASGLAPDVEHAQHIHGTFDEDGNPTNATTPTIDDDADLDGTVEVLEGLPAYGDILLPLATDEGGSPMSDSNGQLSYFMQFDISDESLFVSPVTGEQYSFEDIAELVLREYVIHGVVVPDGIGEGTEGEVDGGENGYIPLLPAGADEIEAIDLETALFLSEQQKAETSGTFLGDSDDNVISAGGGEDEIRGGSGDDELDGGGDADFVFGGDGNDMIWGGSGDDTLLGGNGADDIEGGDGDDLIKGGTGDDDALGGEGNDVMFGEGGNDSFGGGAGDDVIVGMGGNDSLTGGGGNDELKGGNGDDLLVGGDGDDLILGGDGADIIGGLGGNDKTKGGAGADEFHFDAGTGTDNVADFVQGEDVISFLDDGAISFANSTDDGVRGDSDLSAADFDTVSSYAELDAANDQQVVFSSGGISDLENGSDGAAIEAYIAANNGTSTVIFYDDDWSTTEGREEIAILNNVSTDLTVSDFDVY